MAERKTSKTRAQAKTEAQPDPADQAPATVTKTGHERPVEKVRDGVWWCPYCDHSQPVDFDACAGCGAKRGS